MEEFLNWNLYIIFRINPETKRIRMERYKNTYNSTKIEK